MAKKSTVKEIKIPEMPICTATITIEGDTDLILNKMNRRNKQDQLDKQAGRTKKHRTT